MIRWNSSQQDPQRLIRISIPPVKALASALGANYQPTIQQVLKEREDELNQLHARLMLGFRHNATVPRKDELLAAIAPLHPLGIFKQDFHSTMFIGVGSH